MSNRTPNPGTPDRARLQTSKSVHVIPCSGRSNSPAVKARPEAVYTNPIRPIPRNRNVTPLTPEQQKLVEQMETRWVDLDWHQPQTDLKRPALTVPKVVFEETYRYGPPAAGAKPRHPQYEVMLLAGTEAVVRAARTFDPEFGDGTIDFAEYARPAVRHAVAEQLSDRLVRVPRKRQSEWPKEALVSIESWDNSVGDEEDESALQESRTKARSAWAEKLETALEMELQAPTEEAIYAQEAAQEAALVFRQEWAEGVLSVWGLTPREQRALILRYGLNGANLGAKPAFAEIGAVMGVSSERARQLVRKGERKLKQLSTEHTEGLALPLWSQYSGRSYGREKQRPAWEDDVLNRVDRDRAIAQERNERRRPKAEAQVRAATADSRERRGKPDSLRRIDQRLASGSVVLREVA